MKTNKSVLSFVAVTAYFVFLLGSATSPPAPPVAENFIYTPPSSTSPTKSTINIAILMPTTTGSFFVSQTPMVTDAKLSIDRMLVAMQADIEKIIVARGYTTAGIFSSIDEMTFSQKERASFLLAPVINLDLIAQGDQGTVSGNVTLQLLEPMSKEKVWIQRLNLNPITGQISYDLVNVASPQGPQLVHMISANSIKKLLNSFYMPAMGKIWEHLDPREITNLKTDSDKLKARTNYQGK